MKALNLYSGLGGNRQKWNNVDVTAVEINQEIANIYHDFYPYDKIIVDDAHDYLLQHHNEFDFIWSSPPCPSHSQLRYNIGYKANRKYAKVKAKYPDMKLYEEIILLKYWFNGLWVVENTIPYYEPLYEGTKSAGHIWWSNFEIPQFNHGSRNHRGGTVESLQKRKNVDLTNYKIKDKRKLLRNCVEPEVGKFIFDLVKRKYDEKTNNL